MTDTNANTYIDALIYSGMANSIKSDSWKENIPEFRELGNLLTNTTIKRACCLNSGKKGLENSDTYEVKVRIPLPKEVMGNATTYEKKYRYYDKTIKIPKSVCDMDEFKDYDYAGEGGATQCDRFMKGYCSNILADFNSITGADKDKNKFDMNEFGNFKPECACYTPPPDGTPDQIKNKPQCWFANCGMSPYRPSNMREECTMNIQQCIQNITTQIGNVGSSSLQIDKANLINNCSQDTGASAKPPPIVATQTQANTTTIGNAKPIQTTQPIQIVQPNAPANAPLSVPSNTPSNTPSNVPSNVPSNTPSNVPSNTPSNTSSNTSSNTTSNMYIYVSIGVIILIIFFILMIFMSR